MSVDQPRPGMVRFGGYPQLFFVAICRECDSAVPFGSEADRDDWAAAHSSSTNHPIACAVDIRPDVVDFEIKRRELMERLSERYSHPSTFRSTCSAQNCLRGNKIRVGDRIVQYLNQFYHVGCLPDGALVRLARFDDLLPDAPREADLSIQIKPWLPGGER